MAKKETYILLQRKYLCSHHIYTKFSCLKFNEEYFHFPFLFFITIFSHLLPFPIFSKASLSALLLDTLPQTVYQLFYHACVEFLILQRYACEPQ